MRVIKKIISYGFPVGIAGLLLNYAYQHVSLQAINSHMQQLRLSWVGVAMLISLASHLIRAYRWNLLLQPFEGKKISVFRSFMALMASYMSNLFIPRLGEIVRCKILHRTTGIPIGTLFGTLALERIIDLASFFFIIIITLIFSFSEIEISLKNILVPSVSYNKALGGGLVGLMILVVLCGIFLYYTCNHRYKGKILSQTKSFMVSFKEGFYGIQLSQMKGRVVSMTIIRWGLYYLSDYIGMWAIEATSHLDWRAGLAILTMSSISFAIPIQGGIGAYHVLVSAVLVTYGIAPDKAFIYASIIHAMHFFNILVWGAIGYLWNSLGMHTKKLFKP